MGAHGGISMRLTLAAIFCVIGCNSNTAPEPAHEVAPAAPAVQVQNTEAFDKGMSALLDNYFTVQAALAHDTVDGIAAASGAMADAFAKLDASAVTGAGAPTYKELPAAASAAAKALGASPDLVTARE